MRKIAFSDELGMTEAVIKGRKTQTRRLVTKQALFNILHRSFEDGVSYNDLMSQVLAQPVSEVMMYAPHPKGCESAIAQRYSDIIDHYDDDAILCEELTKKLGWTNKRYVKPDLMPHKIKITDVRIRRLQDVTDDECVKEGIQRVTDDDGVHYCYGEFFVQFPTARQAFASLIDATCGVGTWLSNPYVFVYDFVLVK